MNYINHHINKIICGNALEVLKEIPDELVNCCVCSPPFWGLRDYGVEPVVWDGGKDCKHEFDDIQRYNPTRGKRNGKGIYKDPKWEAKGSLKKEVNSNFCIKCGGWRGSLGLEPTFSLYIKHLCDIFDEVKKVLRKDGTCWVDIGDSYGGSGNASGHNEDTKNLGYKTLEMGATKGNQKITRRYAKSLMDIPYRFSIEMTNRGWVKRNTIIWWKPNCMPSSASDRFTIDFEYLFYFTKNNKTILWTNEKTLKCLDKKPLGTKGIEGIDWEWRRCPACNGEGRINNKICPKCKGLRKVKYSFWTGHDYWFEQQFEDIRGEIDSRGNKRITYNIKTKNEWHKPSKDAGFLGQNPQGRNKRAVWTIPTSPYPEAHFAVYPEGLIEMPIKAGCPEFVCKKCGKVGMKIYKEGNLVSSSPDIPMAIKPRSFAQNKLIKQNLPKDPYGSLPKREKEFIGYTDCGCKDPEYEGGIVLDPFMGAGTTALVALKQRKRFIGIEIKQEYIEMAEKRIRRVQQELI